MNLELAKSVLNSDRVNEARKKVLVCAGSYPTNGYVKVGDSGTASHESVTELSKFCESELRDAIGDYGANVTVVFDALTDWSRNGTGDVSAKPITCAVYFNGKKVVN